MTTPKASPQATNLPEGRYTIDSRRSKLTFTTKSMFGMVKVNGSLTVTDGSFTVGSDPEASAAEAHISAASFDSGNAKRDQDVRSAKYLAADKYPEITFRSDRLNAGEGPPVLEGKLTVREAASPVRLVIDQASYSGGEAAIHATANIDRYAFGVTAAKGMAGRYLTIGLDVVAERSDRQAG